MKTFSLVFIFAFCVTADAWVGIIQYDPSIKHSGHCFAPDKDIGSMKNGEVKRLEGQCAIATCGDNRDIRLTGCGSVGIEPPCRIVDGDLSKPFPDCCYEIVCPKGTRHIHHK